MSIHGVEAGEDHRLDVFKAGQRHWARVGVVGDGIADLRVGHILDGCHKEADFAGGKFLHRNRLGGLHADRFHFKRSAIRHESNFFSALQSSVDDTRQHDHATIRIEPGIEDERLHGGFRVTAGRRQAMHDRFQHCLYAEAGLGADGQRVGGVEPDGLLNHFLAAFHICAGQVNLVDDGDNVEAVVDGDVRVGQGLGFYTLSGVDNQQRAFAGS